MASKKTTKKKPKVTVVGLKDAQQLLKEANAKLRVRKRGEPDGYTKATEEFATDALGHALGKLPKRMHKDDKALGLLLCAHLFERAFQAVAEGKTKKELERIGWLYSECVNVEVEKSGLQVSFDITSEAKSPFFQSQKKR